MKNYLLLILTIGLMCSCGGDDDNSMEMEEMECDGSASMSVDGSSFTFSQPLSAQLKDLPNIESTELIVTYVNLQEQFTFQLVVDGNDLGCLTERRIDILNPPADVSVIGFQFTSEFRISSVSNTFIEDGGSGWLEITDCDSDESQISVEFEFESVIDGESDTFKITGGKAENICF